HILHFTVGVVHPTWPAFNVHTVYGNLVSGLRVWWVALFYILAMAALTLHLVHGIWSVFQTLGVNHPRWNRIRRPLAAMLGLVIGLGFMSIPVAVFFGMLK
ncbi:MAG: succinate dehydrogenase cytochrome b subunit, partial [Gemmatimonadales bacterium]